MDVFYVISGFLIAAILLQDLETNSFSICRFYQRRIARIAPAFFLVIVTTLAATKLIYSEQDFASAGAVAASAALSAANLKFMLMGDYFTLSPDAQPFLHYWSLSLEEQFYLFFPAYIYFVTRNQRPLQITVALLTVSLLLCIAETYTSPAYAFYLLPTRAWELLTGAALTIWRRKDIAVPNWLASLGLVAVGLSLAIVRENKHFPGALAMLPVLGTAAILACAGNPASFVNRVLGHRLPVYIGKRSYSLYLWHWPVFSIVDYQLYAYDGWIRGTLKIAITFAATWLCYASVERPARRLLNHQSQRWTAYGFFVAAASLTAFTGTAIRRSYFLDASPGNVTSGGVVASRGTHGNIVLMGDSQSSMYARDLALLARSKGYSLHMLGVPAAEELPGNASSLWPQVWTYISQHPVDVVIIAEAWGTKLQPDGASLKLALDQLGSRGISVILVQQIASPTKLATRESLRAGVHPPFEEDTASVRSRLQARLWVQSAASSRVAVIDPEALFRLGDGSLALIGDRGRLNYQDPTHLSDTGARLVIPLFDNAIHVALIKRSRRPRLPG